MSGQRRLIHFSGSVQGVGFRYTALRVAEQFDVAGYAKNLGDGRVEIVAEGPPDQIDGFLAAIQDRMGYHIQDVAQQVSEPSGQFDGFGIRF